MKNKNILIIFICGILSYSCSNSPFEKEEILSGERVDVSVIIPEWPPAFNGSQEYPQISYWILELNTASNSVTMNCTTLEREIHFCVNKNEPVSITALPVSKDSTESKKIFFKCSGGIYPYGKENTQIVLSWKEGFTAFLMQSMFKSSKKMNYSQEDIKNFISKFNWEKLLNSVDEKIENQNQEAYNPWLLNKEEILKGISNGSFSARALKMKEVMEVKIPENQHILSSFIPENEKIEKKSQILIKKSEVNVFSDYNLNGILVKGDSVQNLSIENISLPLYIEEYEKNIESSNSANCNTNDFLQ